MSIRKSAFAATLLAALASPAAADGIAPATGAGATFPQPLYEAWGRAFGAINETTVTYSGVGSGDGVRKAAESAVDFGGSDVPLGASDLARNKLVQFPSVTGGVVVVVNLPGVNPGALRLDADTMGRMFKGEIRTWDDPAVAALNGGSWLPKEAVRVVHRADSSGTTYVLTDYLSKASRTWGMPKSKLLNWPTGIPVDGTDAMVAAVRSTPGSIGYVEYSYAKKAGLAYVDLVNAEGRTVQPTPSSFAAATASLDWAAFLASDDMSLVNRPGAASWPLTTATFVMVHPEVPAGPANKVRPSLRTALAMFAWALGHGGSLAEDLEYVPLPPAAVDAIAQSTAAQLPDFHPVADR